MSKFSGVIGYEITYEEPEYSGKWVTKTVKRNVHGEIIKRSRRLESEPKVNDNINISNQFSIVADPFAYAHFAEMRYLEWRGAKWRISDISVEYPRLLLTVGGVYNG